MIMICILLQLVRDYTHGCKHTITVTASTAYLVLVFNTAIVVAFHDHKVDWWSIMRIFLHTAEVWHQVGVLERGVWGRGGGGGGGS